MSEELMIVTCPACRTRYRIRPASLGASGRMVRCSGCGQRWFVAPEPSAPPDDDAAPPPAEPMPAEPRRPRRASMSPSPEPPAAGAGAAAASPRRGIIGWVVLALLVLLLVGGVVGRHEIAAQLPMTLPLYERLGLPVTLPLALDLRGLDVATEPRGGGSTLVVRGEIHNLSEQERVLPPIRVALLDAERRELDVGLFDPPQPVLAAGATARFEIELGEPPPEAKDLAVTFAEPP